MGSAFLVILLSAFAPAIAFMCWCELRDWRPAYLRHRSLSPEARRLD
jgi:hypothetical protein